MNEIISRRRCLGSALKSVAGWVLLYSAVAYVAARLAKYALQ
jgi:hypothetical protein